MASVHKAALYCRIAECDPSIVEMQTALLRDYAAQEGLDVFGVYTDECPVSVPRPALRKMLEDTRDRRFDVVVAVSPSRLERRTEQLLEIVSQLTEAGVQIRFADGTEDLSAWLRICEGVYKCLTSL